jgi:hypothetical protein
MGLQASYVYLWGFHHFYQNTIFFSRKKTNMIFNFEMKIQKNKTFVIRLTKFELLSKWGHTSV